jgi:hypothetical protein
MAYIVVENFSAGLDTRRHPLTARPGTLQTLKNAHVSRGGEIEKRKAFVPINSTNQSVFTRPFFGLQATAEKIYTFTDGWNSETGSNELPVGANGLFVRFLRHPQWDLVSVPGPMPTLTEIVYSNLYGGKTFILAKWSTGEIIPYLDGEFIPDFYIGQVKQLMIAGPVQSSIRRFVDSFVWHIKGGTYGASKTEWDATAGNTAYGAYVDASGPAGIEFIPSATADSPFTITTSTVAPSRESSPETRSKGSFSINGGSVGTPALAKRTVQDIHVMPAIMNVYFNGVKAIEEPSGWAGFTDANNTSATAGWNIGPRLGYNLKFYLTNFARNRPGFDSTPVGAADYKIIQLSGTDACEISLFTPNTNGAYLDDHAQMNGSSVEIEFAASPHSVNHISEFIDPSTITASPYTAGRFIAKFGTLLGGVSNKITSVKVNGTEMISGHVKWAFSNSDTMARLVEKINSFTSTPDYAASIDGESIVLTSPAGSGASRNGHVIVVITEGDVTTANYKSFSGGADANTAMRQTIRYTFEAPQIYINSKVQLVATPKLDAANPVYWGNSRVLGSSPVAALTYKTKAHVTGGSSLFFSGLNQPTKWSVGATGSGFINMSNNNSGNEVLTGIALYQGTLASFARRSIQIWSMDTDPANNRQIQVLANTGALGQKSIVSVGDIDVFYLSDSGVRSVRARDSSNAAVVNDVGTPIDNLILQDISQLSQEDRTKCPAIIEPIDGRYWIAIGSKMYVYSYFPSSQVAAWSTYEPGRTFTEFTTKDGKVYAKEGQTVYVYGGLDGNTYDSSNVEVVLPYIDGGKPAHMKTIMGLDMTCEGEWAVEIGMDPISPEARDLVATISQPTFTLGRIQATGMGTHVGVRMVNQSSGYARIANLITHFDFNESD